MVRRWIAKLLLIAVLGVIVGGVALDVAAHGKPTSITCGGYTVRQYTVPAADESERLTIQRGTKTVLTVSSVGEIESRCADVTGDRRDDLIFQTYSGGAHCCFDLYIYQFIPGFHRILKYAAGNAGGFEIHTVAGRPVLELGDDTFAYFKDLCYACSPSRLPLAACYREGRFVDCTRQYPQLAAHFIAFYTERLKDAMKFTDDTRGVYMRGAALGIYAAYVLMNREPAGLPAIRRITSDPALTTYVTAARPDVAKWLVKRAGYLTP